MIYFELWKQGYALWWVHVDAQEYIIILRSYVTSFFLNTNFQYCSPFKTICPLQNSYIHETLNMGSTVTKAYNQE